VKVEEQLRKRCFCNQGVDTFCQGKQNTKQTCSITCLLCVHPFLTLSNPRFSQRLVCSDLHVIY
jgi:hypothetical protein